MNLELWKKGVKENSEAIRSLLIDRNELEKAIETHIQKFFKYDKIEFSENFRKISLKWKYGVDPVIKNDVISDLDMDWTITTGYSDDMGQGVIIEIYPWGVE